MSGDDPGDALSCRDSERVGYRDPIKHYVRKYGWLPSAQRRLRMLRGSPRRASDFARYFSLCGPEAIDVFFLAENGIVQRGPRGFPGTAVCEANLEAFRDIAPKLGQCAGTFHGTFERVVTTPSFERCCPFDIINLDFTSTLFPDWQDPNSNTVRAIQRMMQIQEEHRRSFDLYLTFRARRPESNPSAVDELRQMMEENLQGDQDATRLFVNHCAPSVQDLLQKDFRDFIARTLPKLLIEFGAEHHFIAKHAATYSYERRKRRTHDRGSLVYFMLKFILAFEFAGGTLSSTHRAISNVRNQIRRSLTTDLVDVRTELANNPSLEEALRQEVSRLLTAADPFRS